MKLLLLLILMSPSVSHADAVIFSGNDVKALKYNLDLFGRSKLMGLNLDPSSGPGVAAPLGSIGMDYLTGKAYLKVGAAATDWSEITTFPAGGATPDTVAGFDSSGKLYSLPDWTFVPSLRALSSATTTDASSLGNIAKFNLQTVFGDGVAGDADNYTSISVNDSTNANYHINNYRGIQHGFNLINGATTDNYIGIDTYFNGDTSNQTIGLNQSIAGDSIDVKNFNIGYSGDVSGGYQGINMTMTGTANNSTGYQYSQNATIAGTTVGFRTDISGDMVGANLFQTNVQGDTSNQLEHITLTNTGAVTNNQFMINGYNDGITGGNLYGLNFNNNAQAGVFQGVNVFNQGPIDNYFTGYAAANNQDVASVTGGSTMFDGNNQGDANFITGVNLFNSGNSTNGTIGLNIQDSSTPVTASIIGVNANITGSYDSVTGVSVNLDSATSTQPSKTALQVSGGAINAFYSRATQSSLIVDSIHSIGSIYTVPVGFPITDTSVIMDNLAGLVFFDDDHTSDPFFNLGVGMVGFVGQVAGASGKTLDKLSMAIGGASVPATSAGGTVTDVQMFDARGLIAAGGTLNVDNMYGFRAENGLCAFGTNCFGIAVQDTAAHSLFQGPVDLENDLTIKETGGADKISIVAPVSIASPYTLTLPVDAGTSSYVLSTDGTGVLSWVVDAVGTGDVVGPAISIDGQVSLFDGITGKLLKASTDTGVAKLASGVLSASDVDLTTEVTGTLPVSSGGTGLSTITANNILVGNGTSAPTLVAPGALGNVLTSDGTTWISAVPGFGSGVPTVPGAGVLSIDVFSFSYGTTNTFTDCTSSPCFLDQIGTGVSSVTRSGSGSYTLNTVQTYNKIKCSGNCVGAATCAMQPVEGASTNSISIVTQNSQSGAALDSYGTITCQGSY